MEVDVRKRIGFGIEFALVLFFVVACQGPDLLRAPDPIHSDLSISVVIENPAGTTEKWEVRPSGRLIRENSGGQPIEIPFLGWPVNGGMIPRTLLARELGGDGEPLDVLVLGSAIPRGEVVRARAIGLLQVVDALERDDKILAVREGTAFSSVTDVSDLDEQFPGVKDILSSWFTHSRPGGAVEVQGYGSRGAANRLIAEGVKAFAAADESGSMPEWKTR